MDGATELRPVACAGNGRDRRRREDSPGTAGHRAEEDSGDRGGRTGPHRHPHGSCAFGTEPDEVARRTVTPTDPSKDADTGYGGERRQSRSTWRKLVRSGVGGSQLRVSGDRNRRGCRDRDEWATPPRGAMVR